MNQEAEHFRKRARECRHIAANVSDPIWANTLRELADELDQEAGKIETDGSDARS